MRAFAARRPMTSEREIWSEALLMVRCYDGDAILEAAERGKQDLERGDLESAFRWHCIIRAIDQLQARAPGKGQAVH